MTKVLFAIPARSDSSGINASLTKTMHHLEAPDLDEGDGFQLETTFSYLQPVDANRNKIVKEFLDSDADWLYMNDSDVVPPPDIMEMVEFGKPVVSGTVCIRKNLIPAPVILKEHGDRYRHTNISEYEDEVDEETGLIEVDGVGTGCLLIHRSVLEGMEPPWFKFQYDEYGRLKQGEDFVFSKKLKDAGVPMYVSTNHVCRHFKEVDLSEFTQAVYNERLEERRKALNAVKQADDTDEAVDDALDTVRSQQDELGGGV